MPSSRRPSVTAAHRHHTVKEEVSTPRHHSARHFPPHHTNRYSPPSHHNMQQAPADHFQQRSHSVRQAPPQPPPPPPPPQTSAYPEPLDGKDARLQQLPSLRTLIDLPPLQTPTAEYAHRRQSSPSPFHTTSTQLPLDYRAFGAEDPKSARDFRSAQYHCGPVSYFDDRYEPGNRPASEASFRPPTGHGAMSAGPDMASPGSNSPTLPSAYHPNRYPSHQSLPEHNQPYPATEYVGGARGNYPYQEQQHLSLATDKRSSMGSGNLYHHPRCIGQKDIVGKGLCYVYDDGSFCEAYVRGEPVNPEWGLTRAGRARKRLAKACNGCREKKVKCEPGTNSRCQRCSRKGQECQWSHYSETSPERESYDSRSAARNIYPRPPEPVYEQQYPTGMPPTPPYTIVSSKNSYEPISSITDIEARPSSKRMRSDSPERGPVPIMIDHDRHRSATVEELSASNHELQNKSVPTWDCDPYQADPAKTKTLLHLYFEYRDTAVNCVLPRESFWRWVRLCMPRSRDEKVLLYAVLAVGSIFSPDAALKDLGNRYSSLACLAEREIAGQHSLSLALARLHLAFYNFATGNGEQSCYYIHASFRTVNALQLNVQEGIMNIPADPMHWDFGLNRVELVECRRRIFWLGYLTERHCSFVSNITLFSDTEDDLFLHLPNNERHYQTGVDSYGPYFDGGLLERNTGNASSSSQQYSNHHLSPPHVPVVSSDLGAMALSVTIAHIWGDVQRHTYRSLHTRRPNHTSLAGQATSFASSTSYAARHDAFTSNTLRRLADWEFSLPGHLQYSQTSTWRNIRCGNSGDLSTYLALQCVYHATRLHLARFARWRELPRDTVQRNIRAANSSARDLLALVSALARSFDNALASSTTSSSSTGPGMAAGALSSSPNSSTTPTTAAGGSTASSASMAIDRAFAQPIIGHAILLAADTVSSAGNLERHLRDTLRSLTDALAVLRCVGAFFATAAEQEALLRARITMLSRFHTAAAGPGAGLQGGSAAAAAGDATGGLAGKATWRCAEPCALVWIPRECDVVYGVDEAVYAEAMAGAGGWPDVRA